MTIWRKATLSHREGESLTLLGNQLWAVVVGRGGPPPLLQMHLLRMTSRKFHQLPPHRGTKRKTAIVSVVSSASLSLASVTYSVMSVVSPLFVVSDAAPVALMLSVILVASVTAFA